MTPAAAALLAECRASPTGIAAGDARWPLVRELEAAGLVRLEWWGPRAPLIRPVDSTQTMHGAIRAFLTAIASGTGTCGSDPTIARRDLLECREVQAMSDAADRWVGTGK